MDEQGGLEVRHWRRVRSRLEHLHEGAHAMIQDFPLAVPDWPADKSRLLKLAVIEAEEALRRALGIAEGGEALAQMADRTEIGS